MTDNDKMREAFEAWARTQGLDITDRSGLFYMNLHTFIAWRAWQAAKSVPVVGEPVAYVNADALRKWESSQKDNWSGALLTARPVPGSDVPLYKAQTPSINEAELERLRKDAERYAVVRDSTYCDVYMHEIYLTDDDLDAAIDAAIAGEKK